MKILHRWPRFLLFAIYVTFIIMLLEVMRRDYIDIQTSSAFNNTSGGVVLDLSLVVEDPQSLLRSLESRQNGINWSTSFVLQSQSPIVEVFVDNISIYGNAELETYCFTSFHLVKDINVPYEVVYAIENLPAGSSAEAAAVGKLKIVEGQPGEFIFQFKKPFCLDRGKEYYVPHLFLGVISSETYANFPSFLKLSTINGYRALEFFPFEKQKMIFNLSSHYLLEDGQKYLIYPSFNVSLSQPGWIGKFESAGEKTILTLSRPSFYRYILIAFAVFMVIIILVLNNIIDEAGGFFEVSFGLLLGLWGMHEILIPDYVSSSIPVDTTIYVLYAFVICEIVAVLIDELIQMLAKRSIVITSIKASGLDNEYVEITNNGIFPIDMTRWVLFDQSTTKFKFPYFILQGSFPWQRNRKTTVKIWTKASPQNMNEKELKEHRKENLYWGRKKEVWDNDRDIAYLEDTKGEAISTYSYPDQPLNG